MEAVYRQIGDNVDWINNTAAAVAYHEVVPLGGRIAVALEPIKVGEAGALATTGIWEMPAKAGEEFKVGDKVYLDATDQVLTTTQGDILAGWIVAPKASAGTVGQVKIN